MPQAFDGGDLTSPLVVLEQVGDRSTVGDVSADEGRPVPIDGGVGALEVAELTRREPKERSEQDPPNRPISLGGPLGARGSDDTIGDEADGRLIGQPGIGTVMRNVAAIEGARQLWEKAPLAADEHRDSTIRDALFEMHSDDLRRDPFGFFGLLVEPVRFDGAGPGGGDHRAGRAGEIMLGDPDRGAEDRCRYSMGRCQDQTSCRATISVEELTREPRHVLQVGAPEAVDRLIGVGGRDDVASGRSRDG